MERDWMTAENLLRKAKFDSAQGRYEIANNNLDSALGLLT